MRSKEENCVRSVSKAALNMPALGLSSLALGAFAAGGALAQEQSFEVATAEPSAEQRSAGPEKDTVTVVGEQWERENPKYTAPLIDTPQTITIIPREVIEQQNLFNLRDILSTLPGITFGAGEGGGGYGDSINLRGYSANSDITIDGVRDSAQYNRTDPFNLEQVEVVNGANSVYAGAGSVGGSINLVSKRPRGSGETVLTAGGGSAAYGRVTVDTDRMIGDNIGVRLNGMTHRNDAPGRDVEEYKRWGVAPSITFGMNSPTRFTLAYVHQEDENIPQYGVPYALGPHNDGPLPGVDPSNYYGYSNVDKQEITVDSVTATFEHEFSNALSVRNLSRWQRVSQLSIVNPPQGSWCIDSGINPWTGEACAAPGTYQPSGPRGTTRDTVNEILINQTDLTATFSTGWIDHTTVAGFVFSHETYERVNGSSLRNPLGETPNPTLPAMAISNPDTIYAGPVNFIATATADGEVDNRAVYVFHRAELGSHFEINGGVRYERNEASGTTASIATPYPAPPATPVVTQNPIFRNDDDLVSYRIGFVYKPVENASLYVAYGNSQTPSQSNVNGSCDLVATCNVDPEEAENYEIGAKWDAIEGRLSLTAALFRNERSNYRVDSNDPITPEEQLDGASRVDGVSLGAAGTILKGWSVFANYTYLDGEILQGVSDFCFANPAAPGCALGGNNNLIAGDPLANTPDHSFSIWTTYETDFGLIVGYGATYQGQISFNRASETDALYKTDPYSVHRAMVGYNISKKVALQVNVSNLFDKEYYERIRNNSTNGWATPGAGRSVVASAVVRF